MKKLNIITALTLVLMLLMACNKNKDIKIIDPPCTFNYSAWSLCSNNVQTRTYTSSPSGCIGTPPADSIIRECFMLITIGTQTWTRENLNVTKYRNGDVIPEVQDKTEWANLTTGAWCYYNNITSNGIIYGKLYNWYAVNDPRGLAPKGYHIPTDAEWTTLTTYLGGLSVAGTKMKSTTSWDDFIFNGWPNNGNGTNTSGFTGLPGGYRYFINGDFLGIGAQGGWWSSSEYLTFYALTRNLSSSSAIVNNYYIDKQYGYSVRCLKD